MKNLKKKTAMIAIGAMTVIPILSTTSVLAQVNTNKGGNAILALEQSYINRLKKRIDTVRLMNGVEKLATGDDARLSGLEGEKKAAEYIASEFKSLGLKTEIREFDLGKAASGGKGYVNVGNESYAVESFNGGTPFKEGFEENIINIGYGNSDAEYEGKDVEGKVVIVKRGGTGDATFANKAALANKHKAGAIIIYNHTPGAGIPWNTAGKSTIPVLGMSYEDGEKLLDNLKINNDLKLTSDINIEYVEHGISRNVVATIPASKNPENAKTVIVGAHFDSVNCPGANDNATGTSVLLEAARILSTPDMKKAFNYNIQFVAFGTEELGLSGSNVFVNELKSSGDIENIQAMINMDMVGTGDTMRLSQYRSEISEVNKIAEKHIKDNEIKYSGSIGTGATSSDHYPFELAGIPVAYFSVSRDPYYHTDNDTIDKITPINLKNTANVLVSTLIDMQDMEQRKHNVNTELKSIIPKNINTQLENK